MGSMGNTGNAGNTGRRPAPRQKLFREKVFWIFKKLFWRTNYRL
jgi:hypothetical protein